jgi:predicted DNA binding CopG/RHH family protein
MNGSTHLSTWVSAEIKERFGAVAAQLGLSESALLKRLVELNLQSTQLAQSETPAPSAIAARGARLYVRLRAEDHLLLRERASARGMPAATYVTMLVRAHLRALTPVPDREMAEVERAVAALGIIGRNLNQIARVANQTGHVTGPSGQELQALLRACTALRDHMREFVRANRASWEIGHEATHR